MNIENPLKGFPDHILSVVLGLSFIILGGYLITLVHFNEPDVTIVWLIIGLVVIFGGVILGIMGIFSFQRKLQRKHY